MRNFSLAVSALLLAARAALGQPGPGMGPGHGPGRGPGVATGAIAGRVYDADLDVPIEYANVVLFRARDSSSVTGTITRSDGRYELANLPPGRYYIDISFIGYRTSRVDSVRLPPGGRVDLGRTALRQTAVAMPGTDVTAERPRLEYRIDKKVINVAQNPAVQNGTAVDALENTPGIKVDVENNVTLRGSGNFTVLVDGRPSLLGSSEALQQLPAGTIDRIEVITNPSAKYDPEGVSGVINVILRRQRQQGLSGIVNVTGGDTRYGGDFLLNLRRGTSSAFIGANYNRMSFPGSRDVQSWTRSGDTTRHIDSDGTSLFGHRFYGLRAGADLQFGLLDRLSVGGRVGGRNGGRRQSARYYHWTEPGFDTTSALDGSSASADAGAHLSATGDYTHNFGRQGHDLALRLDYGSHGGAHDDTTEERDTLTSAVTYGRITTETGPRQRLGVRLEYTLPTGEEDKFEAGYQGRFGRSREETGVLDWDPDSGRYVAQPAFSDTLCSGDDAHALYATWADHLSKLGYQLGLRGEYTGRSTSYETSSVALNQFDVFPTLHLSYKLPADLELMASYTRRIDRPRGWDLQPTERWMDRYNVRRGNPSLKNEYIDALEGGFLLPFGENRLSVEGYCRFTRNLIDRVSSLYPGLPGVMLRTVDNVGSDRALGADVSAELAPFRWWNLTLTGDLYDYRLDVDFADTAYTRTGFNWEVDANSDFRFPTGTRVQLNAGYEGPSVEAQGTEGAFFSSSVAVRQALFNRALMLTLQARDLLSTGGHRMETTGDDFYTKAEFTRKSPVFSLGLTWNFNNYRPERRQRPDTETEEVEPETEY